MNEIQNEIYGKPVVPAIIGGEVTVPPVSQQPAEKVYEGKVTDDLRVVYPGLTDPENGNQNPLFKQESRDLGQIAVPAIIDHTTADWFKQGDK